MPNFRHKDHNWRLERVSVRNMTMHLKERSIENGVFRTSNEANEIPQIASFPENTDVRIIILCFSKRQPPLRSSFVPTLFQLWRCSFPLCCKIVCKLRKMEKDPIIGNSLFTNKHVGFNGKNVHTDRKCFGEHLHQSNCKFRTA